jgi:hypothetical protein
MEEKTYGGDTTNAFHPWVVFPFEATQGIKKAVVLHAPGARYTWSILFTPHAQTDYIFASFTSCCWHSLYSTIIFVIPISPLLNKVSSTFNFRGKYFL